MRHEGIKRALFCVLVTVAMIAVMASSAVAVNNPPSSDDAPHKWTIAMYWCSDNSLDEYTDYFVNLWGESLTNRDDIALCMFFDRAELPANISTLTEDGWVEEADLGEVDSSSPDTLASFITYALTEPKLASENFMLMIQDHGNGYLGLCSDEGLPDSDLLKTWMSIDGLGNGINSALTETGKSIDIIALDACTLASIEIAYELRGTASYLVASQLGVPFDGMDYHALLSDLSVTPSIEPLDLACKLVDDYAAWYSAPLHTLPTLYPYMQDYASLSVIDLNALSGLVGGVRGLHRRGHAEDHRVGVAHEDGCRAGGRVPLDEQHGNLVLPRHTHNVHEPGREHGKRLSRSLGCVRRHRHGSQPGDRARLGELEDERTGHGAVSVRPTVHRHIRGVLGLVRPGVRQCRAGLPG